MDEHLIKEKFGNQYFANKDTYHMGIHHVLGDKIAQRFLGHQVCLDSCLGAGFMTLQLAKYIDKVISVDINPEHLSQAKENAKIANVFEKITFVEGDVLDVIDPLDFDSAFLDPDWAKSGDDKENHVLELSHMVPPADILLEKVFQKTKNVCLRLPKSFDLKNLDYLPPHESESVYQDGKLKFYCVYFGDLIKQIGETELRS